jgi:hypothetical protein
MTKTLALLSTALLLSVATPAFAEQKTFSANLTAAEEVPPTQSTGTGTVQATYDTDTKVFTWTIEYSGLTGEATAAHFHGPAAPGENADPVVPIPDPLASPINGTATLDDTQAADLLAGKWYFNVHTAQYPDGEIRGQVLEGGMSTMPAPASSEAASMATESSAPADASSSSTSY